MYFSDKMRGFNTYAYGIKERATALAETYSLDKLEIFNNEVVIDCGANFWRFVCVDTNQKFKY